MNTDTQAGQVEEVDVREVLSHKWDICITVPFHMAQEASQKGRWKIVGVRSGEGWSKTAPSRHNRVTVFMGSYQVWLLTYNLHKIKKALCHGVKGVRESLSLT